MKAKAAVGGKSAKRPNPGERELSEIVLSARRVLARRKRFAVKVEPDGDSLKLDFPHSNTDGAQARMMDAFGTSSDAFAHDCFGQLAAQVRDHGKPLPTETAVNAVNRRAKLALTHF